MRLRSPREAKAPAALERVCARRTLAACYATGDHRPWCRGSAWPALQGGSRGSCPQTTCLRSTLGPKIAPAKSSENSIAMNVYAILLNFFGDSPLKYSSDRPRGWPSTFLAPDPIGRDGRRGDPASITEVRIFFLSDREKSTRTGLFRCVAGRV